MVLLIFYRNVKLRVAPVVYGLRFKRLRLLNNQAASPEHDAEPWTEVCPERSRLTFLRPCVQEEAPHSCACTPSPGSDSRGSNGKTPDKESVLSAGTQL